MSVLHVTAADFEEKVLKSSAPVLVDFWAPWCGPCQMLGPVLEELGSEQNSFTVVKINIDEEMELAARFGIASIPTLIRFENGAEVKRTMGAQPKASLYELMK